MLKIFFTVFYILLVTLGTTKLASADDRILTFCYDPYPPYTFGTSGAPSGGIKVKLLEAVVSKIDGLDAEVVLLPWKRCQAEAKAGKVDGILPLYKNDDRLSYLSFSEPTFTQLSTFWYNENKYSDGINWSGNFEELSSYKLGMLNGSFINGEMENVFEQKNGILRARDTDALFGLLEKGRVDLIAVDDNVGRYLTRSKTLEGRIKAVGKPISTEQSFFGLSKEAGTDQFLDEFNLAIKKLSEDGTIERIRLQIE